MLKGFKGKFSQNKPANEAIETLKLMEALAYELSHRTYQVEVMLYHRDPAVRRQAIITLSEMGVDRNTASMRFQTLTRMLNDRDPDVVANVYGALRHMGPYAKTAKAKGIEACQDRERDPRIRRAAIFFLEGLLPEEKDLIPVFITALDDPDLGPHPKQPGLRSVSELAMFALQISKTEGKDAKDKLIQIVKYKKWDDYYQGRTLSTLLAVAPTDPATVDIFREWLRQKDDPDRIAHASSFLAQLGPRAAPAIPDLIAILKRKPYPDQAVEHRVKKAVLAFFTAMGPVAKEALPVLRSLTTTNDFPIRLYAVEAIISVEREK